MNKVLVTGLGVGLEFGICASCSLNYSWLISNPSTLIWADKIVIPSQAWEARKKASNGKFAKATQLVMDIAFDQDIIELFKASDLFSGEYKDSLYNDVKKDIQQLINVFPQNIKKGNPKVPDEIQINDHHYCGPYVASLYAGIKISELLNANCLLNERDYDFLKFRYGLDMDRYVTTSTFQSMNEIFSIILPDELVLHNYAFIDDEEQCNSCSKSMQCKDSYLLDIEKNTYKILNWRKYDEVQQAKSEIEHIIAHKSMYGRIDIEDIKNSFKEKQEKVNKNLKKVFPSIKRWTNLTTVIATPISIISASTGNIVATIAAASALGAAKMVDEYIKYYENKNNWVGFINSINKS